MTSVFVTGTDTEVGKTVVSSAILLGLSRLFPEQVIAGYKPIAAGAEVCESGLRNEDGLALQRYSASCFSYQQINPVVYQAAIAPHIAAADQGELIEPQQLTAGLTSLQAQADRVLVEGAGGWHVPINLQQSLSQWVAEMRLPVVLVVGVKLGCLNHAMLTAQAIEQQGLPLLGWVANMLVEEDSVTQQNVAYLQQAIDSPLLGTIPYKTDITPEFVVDYLDLSPIVG